MGIRSDCVKIVDGITRLADAYQKAKGKPMPTCTLSSEQFEMLKKGRETKKFDDANLDLDGLKYGSIKLRVQ